LKFEELQADGKKAKERIDYLYKIVTERREDKEMGDQSLENVDRILEEVLPPEEKLQEHESQAQKSGYVSQEEQVGARGKIPPGFNLSTKTPESFPMGEQISSDEDWDDNCSSEKILF
jgi:hypothetical protein